MVLLGLSAGHKIGLGVMGAVFIVFALISSFVAPRYRPGFPGRAGIRLFIVAALALFVGMMAAVTFFGKESEAGASEKSGGGEQAAGGAHTIQVTAKDFHFALPKIGLTAGDYVFELRNAGPSPHNLVVNGPGVDKQSTPTIGAGKTATVKATLKAGTYDLYCSVPGHKQLGMDVKVRVT